MEPVFATFRLIRDFDCVAYPVGVHFGFEGVSGVRVDMQPTGKAFWGIVWWEGVGDLEPVVAFEVEFLQLVIIFLRPRAMPEG